MWQQELPDRHLIYEEIGKGDLAKVVLTTLNIMKGNNLLLPSYVRGKSQNFSEQCRNEGNTAYRKGAYQKALEFYNKALLYAPKDTYALALAYSNRSALLFTMKQYAACLRDIEVSLGLNCPPHVVDKLQKRKMDAISHLWEENLMEQLRDRVGKSLFDFNDFPRNRQVPCASTDLEFTVESGIPKVVAAKHVKVGAVLAMEKAFFSSVEEELKYTACHYCQNVEPHLIPCDGCCNVLFCSEDCKQKCMTEYHNIDCKILVRNDMMPFMQATIKLKNLFSSWKEFIKASNLLSLDRIEKSTIDEIFNGENKLSVLNYYNKRHFWHGRVYNFSLKFAQIIYGLIETNSFFPEQLDEKQSAILAVSRVLMYMSLHIPYMDVMSCITVKQRDTNELLLTTQGMFPLLGKLPHSCDPNALMVGLNNRIALVAIKPITPGTPVMVSYAGHRLDYRTVFRQDTLMIRYGISCLCDLCMGIPWVTDTKLNDAQNRMYRTVMSKSGNLDVQTLKQIFNSCLKALASLSDMPFCREYQDVYTVFRKFILDIQSSITQNCMLDKTE